MLKDALRKLAWLALLTTCNLFAAGPSPQRIVSLSPNTTEILSGVGAFSHVIAVSQYCIYPPEAAKLPRINGWQTSNIEKVVALRPDLVVLTKDQEPFLTEQLKAFNLHYVAVPSESLADIFQAIQMIGSATGNEKQAADLMRSMHSSLDKIREATKDLPRRSVLLSVSRTPGTLSDMYVATAGSYLVDLIEIAGGSSVTAPARTGYGKISKEAILSLNPEVVIDVIHKSQSPLSEHPAEAWNDLPELRAVRERHVYTADDPYVPHPSQFVVQTAGIFERMLHPEEAGQVRR